MGFVFTPVGPVTCKSAHPDESDIGCHGGEAERVCRLDDKRRVDGDQEVGDEKESVRRKGRAAPDCAAKR